MADTRISTARRPRAIHVAPALWPSGPAITIVKYLHLYWLALGCGAVEFVLTVTPLFLNRPRPDFGQPPDHPDRGERHARLYRAPYGPPRYRPNYPPDVPGGEGGEGGDSVWRVCRSTIVVERYLSEQVAPDCPLLLKGAKGNPGCPRVRRSVLYNPIRCPARSETVVPPPPSLPFRC